MGKSTANRKKVSFAMLLVTIGIVYGDIGTSPMYVMKSIIIWTITLLTTTKHVLIAMRANKTTARAASSRCTRWCAAAASG